MTAKTFDGRKTLIPGYEGAGVEILSIKRATARLSDQVFMVRHDCCGTEGEMRYETLYARVKAERDGNNGADICCASCARRRFAETGRNYLQITRAQPSTRHLHMRNPALRMAAKGNLSSTEIDDWLEIPRGSTARWLRESGKPQPPKTEIYAIPDPVRSLALSGAWR